MLKLTKEQCVILTGYTGILHGSFSDFHKDLEDRLKRPIYTHEIPNIDKKELYKEDFLKIASGD